ncbi:MAG: radical SAM protein [Anaerolineae bacterium]|jgi:MoaA/NifB/PqqE/SkfB family radical SAM enzyme|nr:radical SAM protein [Anaerolineae bacterium]MDH7475149.1 radical SAM protein [Anaerolineae bacterium]
MVGVLLKIPLYRAFRRWGVPRLMPLNLTVSMTYRCNSRCRTCNVWRKQADELTAQEWDRVFASLGRTPYWFTISGGEPLLRQDVVEICHSVYQHCRPGIINVPTNGLRPELIAGRIEEIARACPKTRIIVNVSLDGWGEQHDAIRNVPGNFQRTLDTYRRLRALALPNLTVGIHTVISRFNVDDIPQIYREISALAPDSYITEIAEERVELDTVGADITPGLDEYSAAVDFLLAQLRVQPFTGISRVTQAFREQYYGLVKRILAERRQVIPCYAGWASAQISPEGNVWVCCIKAESLGNLRDVDYNFGHIWFNAKAAAARASIARGECFCPLANAAYTNMLCHYPSLFRAARRVLN